MAEVLYCFVAHRIRKINHPSVCKIQHGLYYAGLYLELMQKLARVDVLQKVLVLIHDMLDGGMGNYLFHHAKCLQNFKIRSRRTNRFVS